jgi:hypothetical protein
MVKGCLWYDQRIVANQHVMISHQHVEAISTTKQEAKWKQEGSKQEVKWKQSGSKSMEHARKNGFATEASKPLGGKPEGLLPLGGKSERLLPQIAKQPQDVIGDVITVD